MTPNKAKPFLVYSDYIIKKVVGTSFSIRRKQEGSIEVSVVTGIVKVQNNFESAVTSEKNREVTLTPNKKVTFFPKNETMLTGLVDQPVII
ncbi:FecR family protein [Dyadobacter frigoris]|uniref:FecR family protein n=1 Tax=Dyadobacter frigoris TaxID=2576211 RepID=UPI001E5C5F5A|nr:FecR family protein [Dyadobacter frigoris]